jgi:hypothetical protein
MDDLFWAETFRWPPDVVGRQPIARMRRLAQLYGAASEGREMRRQQDERTHKST